MIRFCEQCLQLRPQCIKALSRRGLARIQLGDYSDGEGDVKLALSLLPEDDTIEQERLKVILMKAKKGLHDQTKALDKRKVSIQKAFAAKEGGIGDIRVKSDSRLKKSKHTQPQSQPPSCNVIPIYVSLLVVCVGIGVAYIYL